MTEIDVNTLFAVGATVHPKETGFGLIAGIPYGIVTVTPEPTAPGGAVLTLTGMEAEKPYSPHLFMEYDLWLAGTEKKKAADAKPKLPPIQKIAQATGSQRSVVFVKLDTGVFKDDLFPSIRAAIQQQLIGSCLEGCVVIVYSQAEIAIVSEHAESEIKSEFDEPWYPIYKFDAPQWEHVWVRCEDGTTQLAYCTGDDEFMTLESNIAAPDLINEVTHWSKFINKQFTE